MSFTLSSYFSQFLEWKIRFYCVVHFFYPHSKNMPTAITWNSTLLLDDLFSTLLYSSLLPFSILCLYSTILLFRLPFPSYHLFILISLSILISVIYRGTDSTTSSTRRGTKDRMSWLKQFNRMCSRQSYLPAITQTSSFPIVILNLSIIFQIILCFVITICIGIFWIKKILLFFISEVNGDTSWQIIEWEGYRCPYYHVIHKTHVNTFIQWTYRNQTHVSTFIQWTYRNQTRVSTFIQWTYSRNVPSEF